MRTRSPQKSHKRPKFLSSSRVSGPLRLVRNRVSIVISLRPRLALASIADLEAKLSGRVVAKRPFQGRQQFGFSKLELLGPNRAVDLEFEHVAPNAERSAMCRDLRANDLLPACTNLMRLGDGVESEIFENPTDQIADPGRGPPSTSGSSTQPTAPPRSR